MGWMLFEAKLALAVMLAAVWWTFRGRSERSDEAADAEDGPGEGQ